MQLVSGKLRSTNAFHETPPTHLFQLLVSLAIADLNRYTPGMYGKSRLCVLTILALAASLVAGPPRDLGNGFLDHGVCAPISEWRGIVATSDGTNNLVLAWLMDHRGGYELLLVDVDTGKFTEHLVPFNNNGDSPYASLLSSAGKLYTQYGSHFVEFDPVKRAFTFVRKATPSSSMSLTEDDAGVIWSVSYPNCGVVSYDPRTGKFRDYGSLYKQNWLIYPRYIAADDRGWIYIGLGNTASQLIALDPEAGNARPILTEAQRLKGTAYLYRDLDGKVYGRSSSGEPWWELYHGQAKQIGKEHAMRPKTYIAGGQSLFHTNFPDGKKLKAFDLEHRHLVIEDQKGQTKNLQFDYASEGAMVLGLISSPQGTIIGGTAFPFRCFTYDPAADQLTNRACFLQWNALGRSQLTNDHHIFAGIYPSGHLLDWNTDQPWIDTDPKENLGNPRALTECHPDVYRTACVLPLSDGKTVVMGGPPGYGYTGGGLLFWDRQSQSKLLLTHKQIIPDQSTMSVVELKDGTILCGTTTAAGTGGEKKAKEAELYIMRLNDHRVAWHQAAIPGIQSYNALHRVGELVLGVADRRLFFVFDPITKKILSQNNFAKDFGESVSQQGPRPFVIDPTGQIYLLTIKGVVAIENGTWNFKLLAKSPVPAIIGGDYLNGRIYFCYDSHLYSWFVSN